VRDGAKPGRTPETRRFPLPKLARNGILPPN